MKPKTKHAPGVFSLMAQWKSYEISNWLETTNPNAVRALFETGSKAEDDREALIEAIRQVYEEMGGRISRQAFDEFSESCKTKIGAALARAEGRT